MSTMSFKVDPSDDPWRLGSETANGTRNRNDEPQVSNPKYKLSPSSQMDKHLKDKFIGNQNIHSDPWSATSSNFPSINHINNSDEPEDINDPVQLSREFSPSSASSGLAIGSTLDMNNQSNHNSFNSYNENINGTNSIDPFALRKPISVNDFLDPLNTNQDDNEVDIYGGQRKISTLSLSENLKNTDITPLNIQTYSIFGTSSAMSPSAGSPNQSVDNSSPATKQFQHLLDSNLITVRLDSERSGLIFKHVTYSVHSTTYNTVVKRRYSDFAWLFEFLMNKYPIRSIPMPPPKKIATKFDEEFLQKRRRGLHRFLQIIANHYKLSKDSTVKLFFTASGKTFKEHVSFTGKNVETYSQEDSPVSDVYSGETSNTPTESNSSENVNNFDFSSNIVPTIPSNFETEYARFKKSLQSNIVKYRDLATLLERIANRNTLSALDTARFATVLQQTSDTVVFPTFEKVEIDNSESTTPDIANPPWGYSDLLDNNNKKSNNDESKKSYNSLSQEEKYDLAFSVENVGFMKLNPILRVFANIKGRSAHAMMARTVEHMKLIRDMQIALMFMLERADKLKSLEEAGLEASMKTFTNSDAALIDSETRLRTMVASLTASSSSASVSNNPNVDKLEKDVKRYKSNLDEAKKSVNICQRKIAQIKDAQIKEIEFAQSARAGGIALVMQEHFAEQLRATEQQVQILKQLAETSFELPVSEFFT